MTWFAVISIVLAAALPPLTSEQRTRLETARDGRDHQEEAFVALLDHVEAWTGDAGDAAIRLHPDFGAMIDTPDDYRGDLCRLEGMLLQRTMLVTPFDRAEEWFLRDHDGVPFVVYVAHPEIGPPDGARVRILARYYKSVRFEARDGQARDYAAFVGRYPERVADGGAVSAPWIVAGPVLVMMLVFLLLMWYARRAGGRPSSRRARLSAEEYGESEEALPDDPSDALAVLRDRAEETGSWREIEVELGTRSYCVTIGAGLLPELGKRVADLGPRRRVMLVVDRTIAGTHGAVAARSLEDAGYELVQCEVIADEAEKSLAAVDRLYEVMLAARLERGCLVVAVGGGVTGDVAGFVAATYLRGVPIVQVPTTLLAAVDASIGGKTGVNHRLPAGELGKNLIGAFWQPRAVIIDPRVLDTLEPRDLRCGLAECIKHAMIADADHLKWIEASADRILARDAEVLTPLIARSVEIKAGVVAADERETGARALLNLGHTFAHAIEPLHELDLRHGEAVGIGLIAAATVAVGRGELAASERDRLVILLKRLGLPTGLARPVEVDRLIDAMRFDKKVRDGVIRLVLPHGLGRARIVDDGTDDEVRSAWAFVGAGTA